MKRKKIYAKELAWVIRSHRHWFELDRLDSSDDAEKYKADLSNSDLEGVSLVDIFLREANFQEANLSEADFEHANLMAANLTGVIARETQFSGGLYTSANFEGADLEGANFFRADLSEVNFTNANLKGANLFSANLSRANLAGADLRGANLGRTVFGDVDLSVALGLEEVKHTESSDVSINTIYRSKGAIPLSFLRGCGIPDEFISIAKSLSSKAIEFYSCFISYSSHDQQLAERLHADLQNNGVRCWYAPEDLKIGSSIRDTIDESIRVHDKLLLLLSQNSIRSQWVQQEVEATLEKERKNNRLSLFPIRLDNEVMNVDTGWAKLIKNTRNIGDFTNWKDHDSYQIAFKRLLRDLKNDDKEGS